MAVTFPAQAKITPSFSEPNLVVTYAQASGCWSLLPDGKPTVKISSDDLAVYINHLDIRSQAQSSQFAPNFLPSATLKGSFYQTATYLIRVRADYDRHDMAAAANYAVGLPNAYELAMRQGIYQQARTALLYGLTPSNGEGLLNAPGATLVNLPPDPYGATTVTTYDNGAMAIFILQEIVDIINRMYMTGGDMKGIKVRILSPQRIFVNFQISQIVQVTSFQRPGGGTATVGQTVQEVLSEAGIDLEWGYDDTLIGKGSGGADAVIITVPELEIPTIPGINTNEFGEVNPNLKGVNLQYADMPAPMKIPTPIPDGGITEVYEQRFTCGWNIRPQGLTIVSMTY